MATQSAIAYGKIKDMILHMELFPSTRISELQLSAAIKISRTSIHDALRKLAAEGLVIMETNRSAVVKEFTDDEIKEVGTIRMIQDILSAQLASYYGSAADFDGLGEVAKRCMESAKSGDAFGRIKADGDFHLEIARISGNTHLYNQQFAVYQQIHLIQISKYTGVEDSLVQIHHHEPLIKAIRNGDMKLINHLICDHVKDFYNIDPFILQCYGIQP